MASRPPAIYRVFGAEIDRLRALLRDLEPADVPVPLRRVVAYAGGRRLPPPLLKSLLVEIDRNEWLRGKLVEDAGEDVSDTLAAFLAHEPAWWLPLVDAAADTAPQDDHAPEIAELRARLEEAKRRMAEMRGSLETAEAELREVRGVRRREDELRTAQGDIARLERELYTALAARDEAVAGHEAAERRVAEMLHRDRRRETTPARHGHAAYGGGVTDPIDTARRLDRAAAGFAASVTKPADVTGPGDADDLAAALEPVALPAGVAPDTVAAIDWLLAEAPPLPVIIDGYNVTYLLDSETFTTPAARRRLVVELERFVRRALPGHRVSVFFDSSESGPSVGQMSPGGVEIVFATEADTADDAIVEEAEALGGRAVVVTNDRELRERCGDVGALVLWGSALVAWIGG